MSAFGYIRLSVVHDPAKREAPPPQQEAAIRALAARHGDEDVTILTDLDKSGKLDRSKRPGWDQLLRAIESGEAHAVYAYSLSRFARSVQQLAEFAELCKAKGVAFRVEKDVIDTSTASGQLMYHVLAALAQFESDVASERIKSAFTAKGIKPGALPYGDLPGEDPQVVIDAYREAGSFTGAARLLNARGVPARKKTFHDQSGGRIGRAGALWYGTTVSGIVRANDPDAIGPKTTRGVKSGPRAYALGRLLTCGFCDTFLTSSGATDGTVRYYCKHAEVTPHPRAWVSEKLLLPQIAEEFNLLRQARQRVQIGSRDDEAAARALERRRERVQDMYEHEEIDRPEYERRLADIHAEESRLSVRRWVTAIPLPTTVADTALIHATDDHAQAEAVIQADGSVVHPVTGAMLGPDDYEVLPADPPANVNEALRRVFDRVVVESMREPAKRGPAKQPIKLRFEWRDPDLRASE